MAHIEPKTRSRIRSALRKIWSWSENKRKVLFAARISRGVYICSVCEQEVAKVEIDHFPTPVGPTPGSRVAPPGYTWDEFMSRLFCGEDNLRAVCKNCHKGITKKQRANSVHKTKE